MPLYEHSLGTGAYDAIRAVIERLPWPWYQTRTCKGNAKEGDMQVKGMLIERFTLIQLTDPTSLVMGLAYHLPLPLEHAEYKGHYSM